MNFAENNRISHRQLYRQIVISFLAPFLLCLFGQKKILGPMGMLGTVAATAVLLFYVIFLIRLAPYCGNLRKHTGKIFEKIVGVFFIIYVILAAAFLLHILGEIVPQILLTGVDRRWVMLAAVVVCSLGTHKGMQRRGRIAEVAGAVLLCVVVVMMILSLGQSKMSYFLEMRVAFPGSFGEFLRCSYGVICAFSGIGLLPFVLEHVEKSGSAWKPVSLGILTLGIIVLGMLFLLPAVFGWERLLEEEYPILPLLAGANLPGNVLARFDVLWMGFLLFSLLFALGSLFHYGHQVIRLTGLGTGRYWMAAVVFLLSFLQFEEWGVEEYFGVYLGYVFVPGLLLIHGMLFLWGKEKRKKKAAAAAVVMLACSVTLSGCSGVEPEKRMYPLALGIDAAGGANAVNDTEGTNAGFKLVYGMPDLPQATGQDKPEESGSASVLAIQGSDFSEIEERYNRSQEKYLDMGHLQVLILGNDLIRSGKWRKALEYLEQEKFVGENLYVFWAEDPEEVLAWKGRGGSSVGEYLIGILENRTSGQQKRGVTLREVYHGWYQADVLIWLPEIRVSEKEMEVFL